MTSVDVRGGAHIDKIFKRITYYIAFPLNNKHTACIHNWKYVNSILNFEFLFLLRCPAAQSIIKYQTANQNLVSQFWDFPFFIFGWVYRQQFRYITIGQTSRRRSLIITGQRVRSFRKGFWVFSSSSSFFIITTP